MGATLQRHSRCESCTVKVTLDDYRNDTLVPGSPPAAPDSKETIWALAQRMAEGDCAGVFHGFNCYTSLGTQTTINEPKRGMKLVQARKINHGRFGFLAVCLKSPCDVEPTRYLSIDISASVSAPPEFGNFNSTYEGVCDVDSLSGCPPGSITQTGTAGGDPSEDAKIYAAKLAEIGTACQELEGEPVVAWQGPIYTGHESPADGPPTSIAWTIWGNLNLLLYGNDFGGGTFVSGLTFTKNTLTNTKIEIEGTWDQGGGNITSFALTIQLSNPYSDVVVDVLAAAATWSLTSNDYLRWRTDTYRAMAPLASYDEAGGPATPVPPGLDGGDCLWTGDIVGAPFTNGLPDTTFGFDVYIYDNCDSDSAISLYGRYTPTGIPTQAPNWTPNIIAGREWPGYGYDYEGNGTLTLQKGLEILEHYPSFNFFRMDRWLLDTGAYSDGTASAAPTSSTIDSIAGPDIVTVNDISAAFSGGTKLVSINTGPQDGEIWYATAAGTTITLTAQLVTDSGEWAYLKSLVQAAYTEAGWTLDQGTNGRIGILRFQFDRSGTQWPMKVGIRGRVAVTASTTDSWAHTKFTLGSSQQLITGDLVDALSSDYATTLGANLSVTWVSATEFMVIGDYRTAAWLKSSGAPHYLWNDANTYGDFVVQRTTSSLNDDNEFTLECENTEDNAGISACPVLACTPNDDAPAGAHIISFPATLGLTTCGFRSWAYVLQRMVDLVWQEPISDFDIYIGCPHLVEARLTQRPGTRGGETCPALPANCAFTVPATSPAGSGVDDICNPAPSDAPWVDPCR